MRPFNTVHDVSIKRKTVDEALALLPIWLHDLLLTLWQKKWEILFAILTNNNNIICMKSVCSTCWRLCRLLCWPDHPICKHWRLFITSCPGKEFVILVQIFILQIPQDYIRKEAEYDWVQLRHIPLGNDQEDNCASPLYRTHAIQIDSQSTGVQVLKLSAPVI